MIDAICFEIELQKSFIKEDVRTIYFGGGTPSLVNSKMIDQVLLRVKDNFDVIGDAEITLEANPDDISTNKLSEWGKIGINRLSLGLQTFDNDQLVTLNRSHSTFDAERAIGSILNSNIENFTIDLIYGLPGQGLDTWRKNLEKVIGYDIPHISSYALTIEEKTVLGHWQKKGKMHFASEEDYEKEYNLMCELLRVGGYTHYEVSNFAKPGFKSAHNSAYWMDHNYLGLGPAAHSFNGKERFFNISNNSKYIKSIGSGIIPNQSEELTEEDRFHEYLLTGLRTNSGVSLQKSKAIFGKDLYALNTEFIEKCIAEDLAVIDADMLILTEKGFFLSDSIIIELMN